MPFNLSNLAYSLASSVS